MNEQRSVIQLVDDLIKNAIANRASDVHLESKHDALRVRFRIDGLLYDQMPIDRELSLQIIARIKVLAHLDMAQRRIPQDGKFRLTFNDREIDIRVSSFPGIYGEKVVLRILDGAQVFIAFDKLGLHPLMYTQLEELLRRQSGFFLATGPTGSGKTTSLYAVLTHVNTQEKNIITLEDPVEYSIEGITQGQIQPGAGFTFARGIRAMLRQDPDIVMIGEIRDQESAQIAIESALTGHLVLSTAHTNDAATTVMRLMDMGIEPFLINAALSGVLAQRLARVLCKACCIPKKPDENENKILSSINLPLETIYESHGCQTCAHLGYKGRIGIFELLVMSHPLRSLIVQNPSFQAIEKQCKLDGMRTMLDDAKEKVKNGIISLQELVRVAL